MQKQILSKKFLSAILSISVIMGTLFALPTYATAGNETDTGPTVTDGFRISALSNEDVSTELEKSFLEKSVYMAEHSGSAASTTVFNDKNLETGKSLACHSTKNRILLTINLAPSTASSTTAVNHKVQSILISWGSKVPASYEIYASINAKMSTDKLTSTYKVCTVSGMTEKDANSNQLITFNGTREYAGMMILINKNDIISDSVELNEIGICYDDIAYKDISDYGVNLLHSNNLLTAATVKKVDGMQTTWHGRTSAYLVDGKTGDTGFTTKDSESENGYLSGHASGYEEADKGTVKWYWQFSASKKFSMFLLSYGEEAPVNSYKIHISDDEGTLWNNETVVASGSYDNPNTANRLITLETPVEGKYVGFEFSDLAVLPYYYTLKGAEGVNLMELGAYENALYKYSVNNDYFSNGKEQSVDGSSCTITISDTEQVNALLVDGVNYTISVNNTEISSYTGKKLLILPMSFTNTEIEISGMAVNAVRTYSAFERIKGDLNGDCVLNDSDLLVMRRVLLGLTELDGLLTDINGNTVIDICDLVALKKNQP